MTKHGKNSCSGAVFTHHEKSKLEYGTKIERLPGHSMKAFDMCGLCLKPVVMPMVCQEGHIYCKECIYGFLLTQKHEVKKSSDKPEAVCPSGSHSVRLKNLTAVKFSPAAESDSHRFICPCCVKALTNSSKVGVIARCGHAVCMPCIDKFVRGPLICYVCETSVHERDIIVVQQGGTGFAAHNKVEAEAFKPVART